jgi:hypothetical protein
MEDLGILTISFHIFDGPAKARHRLIVVKRRHHCTLGEAKKICRDFKENNQDSMNVQMMEARWQPAPEIISMEDM